MIELFIIFIFGYFLHYIATCHYFGVHENLIQVHPHVISGIGGHTDIIKAYFNAKSDLGAKGG